MTKEELAAEYLKKWLNGDIYHSASHSPSNCFYDGFIAGYSASESEIRELREKLDVAVKALDFTLHAAEYLYQSNKELPKGLGAMFYHTLTYEGDLELIQKTKKAREDLSRIRGGEK